MWFRKTLRRKNDEERKHVALFGSSFNPPTRAHIAIVQYFMDIGKFDEIWLLPVYKHMYSSKSNLLDFETRYDLVTLCLSALEEKLIEETSSKKVCKAYVKDTERVLYQIRKGETPDTVAVISYLKQQFPKYHFSFIVGQDEYTDLSTGKWPESDILGDPNFVSLEVVMRDMNGEMREVSVTESFPANLNTINTIPKNISSSVARTTNDENELRRVVLDVVAERIIELCLYGFRI